MAETEKPPLEKEELAALGKPLFEKGGLGGFKEWQVPFDFPKDWPEAAKDIDELNWPGVTLLKVQMNTDYDERALLPRQVFFPMPCAKDGWNKLAKNLKATLNEERLTAYHGTVSLLFAAGKNRKVAVKLIDDRGIESLKILPLV